MTKKELEKLEARYRAKAETIRSRAVTDTPISQCIRRKRGDLNELRSMRQHIRRADHGL